MELSELPLLEIKPDKVMVKRTAIGFNMVDTYLPQVALSNAPVSRNRL